MGTFLKQKVEDQRCSKWDEWEKRENAKSVGDKKVAGESGETSNTQQGASTLRLLPW